MKDIEGYEGLYAVTSCGKVWSYRKEGFLKPFKSKKGYLEVDLRKPGTKRKIARVHRLVLATYNPVENMDVLEVNHLDECKTNNCLNNLEWVTTKENNNYGTAIQRRARALQKEVICVETGEVFDSLRAAAESINRSSSRVSSSIQEGSVCGGYHWAYVDWDYLALLDEQRRSRDEVIGELVDMGMGY